MPNENLITNENRITNERSISKANMRGFLEHLSKDRTLVGPVDTGKVVEYRETVASEVLMDDRVTYNSIKSYYFPQTELMFTFENEEVEDNTNIHSYAIFGARPCDMQALKVMSVVYTTGKYADPFFQRRYEANFLIGVGCINSKPECFCHEMGVDREYSDFCDILLKDDGESYSIEHLSEKGSSALREYMTEGRFLCHMDMTVFATLEPSPCLVKHAKKTDEPSPSLDPDKDDTAYFDIIDWAKATEACKGCGICTYICPTCYCFDFKDVSQKGVAKRYKCWDSCMYPKFTLHASGHNPREHRYERYRQRVLHKYKYVPANFDGCVACTGCGRCVRGCPVGINIKDILMQITKHE